MFHDDQHGTAIISGAALLNACELTAQIEDVTVVVVGPARRAWPVRGSTARWG